MKLQPYSYKLSGHLQTNLLASPMQAQLSSHIAANTQTVIHTYTEGITRLSRLTEKARLLTQQRLAANPDYTFGRGIGVKLAWEYEKLDFQLGGKGSEKWMSKYKDEIIKTGKVSGAEGHHAQNVANHPIEQSNPNNIKFYQNREDHLNQGHGGDFHNESDMQMIDRRKKVTDTKNNTIKNNELMGVGIAALIGLGTAASMTLIIELSKNGISFKSLKEASKLALLSGAYGAGMGTVSYGIYRLAELAVDYSMKKGAIQLSGHALKGLKAGIAGGVLIAGTSTYGYLQLRKEGYSVQDSLIETCKQASLPTVSLALGFLPPPFGPILSVGSAIGLIGYSIYSEYLESRVAEDILIYQLELLYLKAMHK